MEEWLTLTDADIARAHRLKKDDPLLPAILILESEEIDSTPPRRPASAAPLKVTIDDLDAKLSEPNNSRELERLMLNLVNQARNERLPASILGTATLKWRDQLADIARRHSQDMIDRQYMAHATPEGQTAQQRLDHNQVRYWACGENIGVAYGSYGSAWASIQEIHQAFINQPRGINNHRANLLNPVWTHAGIGIALSEEGAVVATQLFISAPGARLRGN